MCQRIIISFLMLISFLHAGNAQDNEASKSAILDVLPEYPGGSEALYKFLKENMKYPPIARKMSLSGTVHIIFLVNTDGSISEIKGIKDLGGGLMEEAMRVISEMPPWTPGTQNGKPVGVECTLPVRFALADDNSVPLTGTPYENAMNFSRECVLNQKYKDAILGFTEALRYNKDSDEAWFGRGLAYNKTEKHSEACSDFEAVKNPGRWDGLEEMKSVSCKKAKK